MADTPVKTLVMIEIGTALQTITELKKVFRWKDLPIELDNITCPSLYFYEGGPEKRTGRNRLMVGDLHLYVDVYVNVPPKGYQDFSDEMDILQAKISNVMHTSQNLRRKVIEYSEGPVRKLYPNDILGLLRMEFFITYAHKAGDAFTQDSY
jgi:hypothetical protein